MCLLLGGLYDLPVDVFIRPLAVSIAASCSGNKKQVLAVRSSLFEKKLVFAFLIGLQSPNSPSEGLKILALEGGIQTAFRQPSEKLVFQQP